ncbi:MAG: hypothetical protein HQK77_04930 [Desulfobacterales bacterium]|nr:hypothetical protein [Desulfobacterales bacterium]
MLWTVGKYTKQRGFSFPGVRLRLFHGYSYLKQFQDMQQVLCLWFYHSRGAPIVPYDKLVIGYPMLNEKEKENVSTCVNELFTFEEITALKGYLLRRYNMPLFTFEERLLIPKNKFSQVPPIGVINDGKPGCWIRLYENKDYNLPFKVKGYLDLRPQEY